LLRLNSPLIRALGKHHRALIAPTPFEFQRHFLMMMMTVYKTKTHKLSPFHFHLLSSCFFLDSRLVGNAEALLSLVFPARSGGGGVPPLITRLHMVVFRV
jgi:hypothetical protein